MSDTVQNVVAQGLMSAARGIADSFRRDTGLDFWPEVEPMIRPEVERVCAGSPKLQAAGEVLGFLRRARERGRNHAA